MKHRKTSYLNWVLQLFVGIVALFAMSASHASLIFIQKLDMTGAGLGAVATVLTLHDTDGTESGSVAFNGANDVLTGDTTAINQTRTFQEMGFTEAADISVIFNPAESGSAEHITLINLVMTIYAPNGNVLFTSGNWANPIDFTADEHGVGNTGFQFALDDPQSIAAQAAAFGANFNLFNRIGLLASISDAQGGIETHALMLFDRTQPCVPGTPGCGGGGQELPEPASLLIIGTGLFGIACSRRRSRRV